MSGTALAVDELYAGYDDVPVLHGISMRAGDDEIVSIIGPNGAGKSTFLKAVAGIVRPARGSVVFGGQEVAGLRPDRLARRGLGFVPQLDNVFPTLTVAENVHVGAQALPRGERQEAVAAVVERFPLLRDRRRQRAGTLSGDSGSSSHSPAHSSPARRFSFWTSPRLVCLHRRRTWSSRSSRAFARVGSGS